MRKTVMFNMYPHETYIFTLLFTQVLFSLRSPLFLKDKIRNLLSDFCSDVTLHFLNITIITLLLEPGPMQSAM